MTWITANFPHLDAEIRARVVAGTTTRADGVSSAPYQGLNLAKHVGDEVNSVLANRAILREQIGLPSEPYWLNQTHTNVAIELPYQYRHQPTNEQDSSLNADASFTHLPLHACTVMTADCLPLLMVDSQGQTVAAVHAGWRGLEAGIIGNTVQAAGFDCEQLHVWLGPAIGPRSFEVGAEVKRAFVAINPANEAAFVEHKEQKYLCDIYLLAKHELQQLGVKYISGGEHCTVLQQQEFYSYRRDGQTGRMASLIWLQPFER